MKRIVRLVLAIAIPVLAYPTHAAARKLAPLHLARSSGNAPITDSAGQIYCMVDLTDDAHEAFTDAVTPRTSQRFDQRHSGKAQNMVAAYEKQYGFEHTDMTSWVGNSFAAYLNPQQVVKLRADPKVVLVSEVIPARFSAPPWYDSTHASSMPPYYETSSWGREAVNGNVSNGARRVHVIDAGVGYHEDLPNVIARVNASCGTNNEGCPGKPVVGCYPHATHVAGIIGAPDGDKGVAGVDAGVAIVSVSALYFPQNPPICSDPTLFTTTVASAMDYVKWDLVVNGGFQVGIVNISINSADFAPGGTLNAKMISLANPYIGGYVYAGSFVAQSAGNNHENACEHSFGYSSGSPLSSDGIMVVGAIDYLGQPVTPANGGFDYHEFADHNEPGSNYGSCVEVWAPGKEILSTWGPLVRYDPNDKSPETVTWQRQDTTYHNYIRLSGTSMAAPHITGVAAYLAETRGLNAPGDIEAAVRSLFYSTGQFDDDGLAVNLVTLPNSAPPIDDFSISLSPTSQTVTPGGGATYSVNTAVTSGQSQAIGFSASGLPPEATAAFSPPSVMAGQTSILTISTTAATPPGTTTFTVNGSAASGQRTAEASLTVAANGVSLYRWWASSSSDHFYTTTYYQSIPGFILEGNAANVEASQVPGTLPFYRFYYGWPRTDHFYTTDLNERQFVLDFGYVAEGIEGYIYTSQVPGTVPLYRCSWCNCDANGCGDCDHVYTTNPAERDKVLGWGWAYDGVAGYVWPATP